MVDSVAVPLRHRADHMLTKVWRAIKLSSVGIENQRKQRRWVDQRDDRKAAMLSHCQQHDIIRPTDD